jgi:hypothetical protein
MNSKKSIKQVLAVALIASLAFCNTVTAQSSDALYKIKDNQTGTITKWGDLFIPKNSEIEIANLEGPGMITQIALADGMPRDSKDPDGVQFTRGLILKIFWDDAKEPSVNVPLSDFFGAFNGIPLEYESYGITVEHLHYECELLMPYSKRARIVLANDGDSDYKRQSCYAIDYEKSKEMASEKSRFHCCWNRSNPTHGMHTILNVKGKGQYIGNILKVYAPNNVWWGEGDSRNIIDGKLIPHRLGTEDEYCSSYYFGNNFAFKNVGYSKIADGTYHMYRWYTNNPVRFSDSLRVEIQNQHQPEDYKFENQKPANDDYISVAFWYQEGAKPVTLQPYKERTAASKAEKY